jgi:hypothetical protein
MTTPEPFFAHRVIRAMTKSCASHDIGLDGFALVAVIAMQWDVIRYRRPVTYHHSVLSNLLNTPRTTLQRIEQKCIAAGWLTKTNQGTRKPCAYTVSIPSTAVELPDTPTDDGDEVGLNNGPNSGLNSGLNNGQKVGTKRAESGQKSGTKRAPFLPLPIPIPIPEEVASTSDETGGADPTSEKAAVTDRELVRPLAAYVRWQTNDAEKSADNLAELVGLIHDHGAPTILEAARQGTTKQDGKLWPNEIRDYLPKAAIPEPQERPTPPEVTQAYGIIDRLGWKAVVGILGFPATVRGDQHLRSLLYGNPPACSELVERAPK